MWLGIFLLAHWHLQTEAICPETIETLKPWGMDDTWKDGIPTEGSTVVISENVLLNVVTSDLAHVTVASGGRLVFDPSVPLAKLVTHNLLIQNGGEVHIGAEDCKFTGNAEIELIGKQGDKEEVPGYGEKFIGVDAGATFEIHGQTQTSWTKLDATLRPKNDPLDNGGSHSHYRLTLTSDVTWTGGERVVIASTDFDWRQAEVVTVIPCRVCAPNEIMVASTLLYTHWGEISQGVDMRAEVGLLTRNIKIHGRMEDGCYGESCNDYDYDVFGGHVKIHKLFASVHIEGVEVYHMGQQKVLGSYPIHFHLAGYVGNMTNPPYVKDVSFHHTFSRCLTVHGTHGLLVAGNVAYRHLGHGFFLEDGAEKYTDFQGNLGIGTMKAKLIPADKRPATFWITNTLTTLEGNVAGGSDKMGFYYIIPKRPIGPSADISDMEEKEALRSNIKSFKDNVAHSNYNGLFFDDTVTEGQIIDRAHIIWEPLEDPKNTSSSPVLAVFDGFVGFKNRKQNVWIKGRHVKLTNFRLSDSLSGVTLARGGWKGLFIEDSIIVGESDNIGQPSRRVKMPDGSRATWSRSLPLPRRPGHAVLGTSVYRGAVHQKNITFSSFSNNILRSAGAVSFKRNNPYFSSPISSVRDLKFTFVDPGDGNRVYEGKVGEKGFTERDGDQTETIYDADGSLTTIAGAQVVRNRTFLLGPRCVEVPNWNMNICPYRYIKAQMRRTNDYNTFMTRDDDVANPRIQESMEGNNMHLSYQLIAGRSYILHFKKELPRRFWIRARGIESGITLRLGVCLGIGTTFKVRGSFGRVNSIAEIDSEIASSKYFFDTQTGILFLKFVNTFPRQSTTVSDCPGDEDSDGNAKNCKRAIIKRIVPTTPGSAVCLDSAYPTYNQAPLDATDPLSLPDFPATAA